MASRGNKRALELFRQGTVCFLRRRYAEAQERYHAGLNALTWQDGRDPVLPLLLRGRSDARKLFKAFEERPTVEELVESGLYEEAFDPLQALLGIRHDERVQHTYIKAAVHSLFPFEECGKWGYETPHGDQVLGPIFEDAQGFSGGLGIVHDGEGWTVIDRSFAPITEKHFENILFTKENGVSPVILDGLRNLLLPSGELLLSEWMTDVQSSADSGLHRVRKDGLYGFVNTSGDWIVEPRFKMAGNFREGLAWVQEDDLTGFIEPSGGYAIEPVFTDTTSFSEGLAGVRMPREDRWAFCDRKGELVCSPLFEQVGRFHDGYCGVQKEGAWGSIDKELRPCVPNVYDLAMSVGGGLHACDVDHDVYLVNRSGVILECGYSPHPPKK